ncbi:GntR family transcriptional regulator [Streptomyces bobili]|uniref:GntR family transcriptional regulator n=1 Tax=Streptomyces bobili TaxID=67280 RepID=UPI00365075DD
MAKRVGADSLAVDVFQRLREDIFSHRIEPGARLKPVQLSEQFQVSTGVIREALNLLAAQGLLRIERNKGFHVITLSAKAYSDLIVARKLNEGAALRMSVERGGVAWESELLAAHHKLAKEPVKITNGSSQYNPAWSQAHAAFHYALIQACEIPILLDICVRLSDAAEVYRAWAARHRVDSSGIAAEHEALLEAALAHDADLAVSRFEQHIDHTKGILLAQELKTIG